MRNSTTIYLNIYSATSVDEDASWRIYRYGRYIGRTVHGDRFAAYAALRQLLHH